MRTFIFWFFVVIAIVAFFLVFAGSYSYLSEIKALQILILKKVWPFLAAFFAAILGMLLSSRWIS